MLSIVQKGGAYGIKRTLRGGLEPHEANAADSDVEAVRGHDQSGNRAAACHVLSE